MQNIVEFFIVLNVTMFFTVFGLILKNLAEPYLAVIFRSISMVLWFILGIFYQMTLPIVPAFGWIFYVVGIAMMLIFLKDVFSYWDKRTWGEVPP